MYSLSFGDIMQGRTAEKVIFSPYQQQKSLSSFPEAGFFLSQQLSRSASRRYPPGITATHHLPPAPAVSRGGPQPAAPKPPARQNPTAYRGALNSQVAPIVTARLGQTHFLGRQAAPPHRSRQQAPAPTGCRVSPPGRCPPQAFAVIHSPAGHIIQMVAQYW